MPLAAGFVNGEKLTPLSTLVWSLTDTGFDINPLVSAYCLPVYGENSDFGQWAIENHLTIETVSPLYFYFSCASLMAYPIALQLLVLTFHQKPLLIMTRTTFFSLFVPYRKKSKSVAAAVQPFLLSQRL